MVGKYEVATCLKAHVVGVERVGHDDMASAFYLENIGQVVVLSIGVVEKSAFLNQQPSSIGGRRPFCITPPEGHPLRLLCRLPPCRSPRARAFPAFRHGFTSDSCDRRLHVRAQRHLSPARANILSPARPHSQYKVH